MREKIDRDKIIADLRPFLYNSEYKIAFLQEEKRGYSLNSLVSLCNIIKMFAPIERKLKKDVALFMLDEIIELFEESNWASSGGTFASKKNFVIDYMRFYQKKGYPDFLEIDVKSMKEKLVADIISVDNIYNNEYFYTDSEIYQTIEEMGVDGEYDLQKAICYFAWEGYTIEEARNMKKSDILEEVHFNGENALNHISKFAKDTKATNSANRDIYYVNSPYVLRSIRQEQLTANNIRVALVKFTNEYQEKTGKKRVFKYDRILMSGRFDRLRNFEKYQDNSYVVRGKVYEIGKITLDEMVDELFDIDFDKQAQKHYEILRQYKKWKDFYKNRA
ncbi:hypothetical protein FACS1894191_4360 [Clostridia bacterium]|nr:hypothetical protein FACS1894191_4360 [Clostridia bacterium]